MVEVKQHDQYVIRVDGSGRVTLRNRKFLRRFSLYEPSIHCPVPVTYQYAREPSKGPTSSYVYTTPKLRHPIPPPRPTEPAISSTPRHISTGSSEPTVSPRCQSLTTPIVLDPPLVELQPSGDTTFTETPASTSPTSDQAPSTAPPSFTPRRSKRVTRPTKHYIEQCDNVHTRSSAGNLWPMGYFYFQDCSITTSLLLWFTWTLHRMFINNVVLFRITCDLIYDWLFKCSLTSSIIMLPL